MAISRLKNSLKNNHFWLKYAYFIPLFQISYLLINYLPIERHVIPMSNFEQSIPLLPWTIIIYLSAFIHAIVISAYIPKKDFIHVLKIIFGIYTISFIAFFLLPYTYPRDWYNADYNILFQIMHVIDSAGNCFPSLHVSLITFLNLAYLNYSKQRTRLKDTIFALWTISIVLSVLTTKQHYILDIVGGLVLAFVGYFILKRYYKSL